MANYLCALDECLYFNINDAIDILPKNYDEFYTLVDILTYNSVKDNLFVCLTHMMFHYCREYKTCIKDEQNCCRLTGKLISNGKNNQPIKMAPSCFDVDKKSEEDVILNKFNQHYFFQFIVDSLQENNIRVLESDALMALIVHLYDIFYKHLLHDKSKQRTTVENRMELATNRIYMIINVILEYILETKLSTCRKDISFKKSVYLIVSAYLVHGKNIHLCQEKSDILRQWIGKQKKFSWL